MKGKLEFQLRSCFCDKECAIYGDCCIDASKKIPSSAKLQYEVDQWNCLELPGAMSMGMTEIYMLSKCPKQWQGEDIRKKCEVKTEAVRDYKEQIPVIGKNTNVTYKNIYCAICNQDTNLINRNMTISCDDDSVTKEFFSTDKYLNSKTYVPKQRQWWFAYDHKVVKCSLHIHQVGEKYAEKYDARVCRPVVRTCLEEWTGSDVEEKCNEFTSYRYDLRRIYKNEHCATCNNISSELLSCVFRPLNDYTSSDLYENKTYFLVELFFDFNFNSGNNIDTLESNCPIGELFDPLKNMCILVYCGSRYKSVDGKCVRDSDSKYYNNRLVSDCHTTSLLPGEYILLPNESVWVNHTNRLLGLGEYELVHQTSDSSMELFICVEEPYERNDSMFNYSSIQMIMSTVCLHVSVICLLMHICIYALLPKLRNVPGKNLLSLSVALLFTQLLFLYGLDSNTTFITCSILSVVTHFFLLAYFFWMNVMAVDICVTFKSNSHRSNSGNWTFRLCSFYAWLTPALIVSFSVLVDHTSFIPHMFR